MNNSEMNLEEIKFLSEITPYFRKLIIDDYIGIEILKNREKNIISSRSKDNSIREEFDLTKYYNKFFGYPIYVIPKNFNPIYNSEDLSLLLKQLADKRDLPVYTEISETWENLMREDISQESLRWYSNLFLVIYKEGIKVVNGE